MIFGRVQAIESHLSSFLELMLRYLEKELHHQI